MSEWINVEWDMDMASKYFTIIQLKYNEGKSSFKVEKPGRTLVIKYEWEKLKSTT